MEQTLRPGGVCCLGSINLTQFVVNGVIDFEGIRKYVKILVRFLDNVNTYSGAPLPEYVDSMRKQRRIGIGVMGVGSMLFMLKSRFGSEESNTLCEEIMKVVSTAAYEASIDLAEERGCFALCDKDKHSESVFIKSLGLSDYYVDKLKKFGIRNSSLMSQQPTGNTSILSNVISGGIEPIFMAWYIRTVIVPTIPNNLIGECPKWFEGEWFENGTFKLVKEGDEPVLKGIVDGVTYKIDKNRGLLKEVPCEDYGVRYLKEIGEWDPNAEWAATTTQLSVIDHVNSLKVFAKYTDSACSKTVNIPNDYPYEDFKNLYLEVYNTGFIKGFTTYRSGTMASVLSSKDEENKQEEIILDDVKLSDSLPAVVKTLKADGKKWYVTVISDESNTRPVAFFVHTNSPEKGGPAQSAVDAMFKLARVKGIPERYVGEIEKKTLCDNNCSKVARAISLCLRHGVNVSSVVSVLDELQDVFAGSFLFAIRKYLSTYIKDGEVVAGEVCPECGGNIIYSEGCKKCSNCSYSKCG